MNPQEMPEMIYPIKGVDLNDFESEYLLQLTKRLPTTNRRRRS
jgi:hypothetical protein